MVKLWEIAVAIHFWLFLLLVCVLWLDFTYIKQVLSIPVMCLVNQLHEVVFSCPSKFVDENDLAGLEKCSKLTKLVIHGMEWNTLEIKGGSFNTLLELDISRLFIYVLFYF